MQHLLELLKEADRLYVSSNFSAWDYFRKTDRPAILRRLQVFTRKFDPSGPLQTEITVGTSSRKASGKDEPTSKKIRVSSVTSTPKSSLQKSQVQEKQKAPTGTPDSLPLFHPDIVKTPSGNDSSGSK